MSGYTRHAFVFCVAVILSSGGCKKGTPVMMKAGKPEPAKTNGSEAKHDDHDHGGLLFADANEKYHLRVEIDAAKKEVEVHVLDEIAKNSVALPAETMTLTIKNGKPHQVVLKAQRPEGKKEADLFKGSDARFADKIDPAKIEISGDILKKNYIFTLDKDHGKK